MGSEYYSHIMQMLERMQQEGTISPKDMYLLKVTDDPDEALHHIQHYVKKLHSQASSSRRWLGKATQTGILNYFFMSVRFEAFYTAAFQTSLNDLDRIRRRIITNYFVIGFVMFAGFTFEAITWMLIRILVIVLFVMFYIRTFGISTQYYQQQFFLRIQGSIGRFLLPSSSFDLNRYIKLTGCSSRFDCPPSAAIWWPQYDRARSR